MTNNEPAASAGQLLKQARLRQRLSIAECAKRTHISARFIESLEEERWSDLPSESHRTGFMQLYSRFLGISADEVMRLYRKTQTPDAAAGSTGTGSMPTEKSRKEPPKTLVSTSGASFMPRTITQVVLLIFLLVVGTWLVYHALIKRESVGEMRSTLWARSKTRAPRLITPTAVNTIQRLRVRAEEDTWLRVRDEHKLLYEGILHTGAVKQWDGAGPFHLKVGHPKGLQLFWNDQIIDLPPTPPGGFQDLQIPLSPNIKSH